MIGEIRITFGPRILKTGLAVALSIYMCNILGLANAVFAGVAAILAVQPSVYRTWKQLLDQIITNTLGASISLFFLYFFGENPIIIGFVIVLMISLSIKLKMETAIPLTLVTVIAIMSSSASGDFSFALERFLVILIGTLTAILVNIFIFPPKHKKKFIQDIQTTFQDMSLLMRTAISNEMTETSFQEVNKRFTKNLLKLGEQFKLFNEEREKLGKSQQVKTREIIVFKQMVKVLEEGNQLLENIEEHYFQIHNNSNEGKVYDQQLEELIKFHEYLLLKYMGNIKENHKHADFVSIDKNTFYHQALSYHHENNEHKIRHMIILSSTLNYYFHLERLEKLINQYLKTINE
ncbi:FUSC family protein [Bacillus weihaiensis]|uniref:FUSC family protein n=1 Tax=Bacillus weihaiensis TaxID=1547283 RepID=UPI0023529EA4|nr:aromatic acid exporter family protein [Bacillus weihaiensis]